MSGHARKGRERLSVFRPSEPRQVRDREPNVVQRRVGMLVHVPTQPAARRPPEPPLVLDREQGGQLQRVREGKPSELAGGRVGESDVAALDRSAEDSSWMALGRQLRFTVLGPDGR